MHVELTGAILAIITCDPSLVAGGAAPVFIAHDQEEKEKMAMYLSRILKGMIHDLENGILIIVKH